MKKKKLTPKLQKFVDKINEAAKTTPMRYPPDIEKNFMGNSSNRKTFPRLGKNQGA